MSDGELELHDLGFNPTFSCRANPDMRAGEALHRYPERRAELIGPRVGVIPHSGPAWVGQFQQGIGGLTGLYRGPTADHLCVVAMGEGYIVDVLNPQMYAIVEVARVQRVCRIPGSDVLCMIGDTDIAAYGRHGLLWAAREIAVDELRVTGVTSTRITGEVVDDDYVIDKYFVIDAATGAVTSGLTAPAD